MGNYESIDQLRNSEELKKWCYDATDILIDTDKQFKSDIESITRKVNENTSAVNAGSNSIKTFNVTGRTSSVNLKQSTNLETTVKVTFVANAISIMENVPKEVKLIVLDTLRMSRATLSDEEVPSFSDPSYLLRLLNISDVTEAKLDYEKQIVTYKDKNNEQVEVPIIKIKEYLHKHYQDNLESKLEKPQPKVEQVIANIKNCATNTGSNDLNIKFRNNTNSFVNLEQHNDSRINLQQNLTILADEMDKLNEKNKEYAERLLAEGPKEQPESEPEEQLESINKVVVDKNKVQQHKQTLQQTEDNTTLIVVCIVVGSIVIGGVIIGVVVYFKLKRGVNKTTENTKKLSGAMINYYYH